MKKKLVRVFKWLIIPIALFLCYVLYSLISSTIFDFQPEEITSVEILNLNNKPIVERDTLTAITWNIGFSALGDESLMFYDQGKSLFSNGTNVREPKDRIELYLAGIKEFISNEEVDFILLQEVDTRAKRSYYFDQFKDFSTLLDQYSASFVYNFKVSRVPIPIFEPWNVIGKIEAGLATFSRFDSYDATRLQLPGSYDWPKRVYHLDRCLAKYRYKLKNGKDLIVINLHNSAYDNGGYIKKQQIEYLRKVAMEEYSNGHYVLIGGDWNQSPPGADLDKVYENNQVGRSIVKETDNFMPKEWSWAFDDRNPSSRRVNEPYKKGINPEKLIDYYLLSPNLEILDIETIKLNYKFSDHEPVRIEFVIK